MSNVIKCPICHEMAGLRYNENRVYQSRCQNMKCRETVTVTAPSGKAAEGLFSKFEKGMSQPKLSIPKKIAEELRDEEGVNHTSYELMVYDDGDWSEELQEWMEKTDQWWFIVDAYLAGEALGVELVEVSDD
ncbi:hypothetical protein ACFSJM_01775 [Lactococcus formosensis subsp. bovis]|uniref:hypothetical protein n=1 Tax=Lactococcus formosensis TaxID=1281486 RepID=UPI001BCBE8A2|nr:hypothetical protein [Lactococcus formosensis]